MAALVVERSHMTNDEKVSLLKAKRDNIITKIEQVEVTSLTPSFFGTYEIYMDADGELYVFQVFRKDTFIVKDNLFFLCSIESHATDNKQRFITYLAEEFGIKVKADTAADLFLRYSDEYDMWKLEQKDTVLASVVDADLKYDEIVRMYEQELE